MNNHGHRLVHGHGYGHGYGHGHGHDDGQYSEDIENFKMLAFLNLKMLVF
jgi:hypothetical protein